MTTRIKKIIEYGTKAPSGHNTQPWKFNTEQNKIQIYPDFNRALPIVDPDNHALYISLGCAAENCVLAANNYGFTTNMDITKSADGTSFIKINMHENKSNQVDGLFNYIESRQVTRNAYSSSMVSTEDLNQLINSFNFPGIMLRIFSISEDIKKIEPFIIEGSNRQFHNKEFVNELISWIRFSKKEVEYKKDGIWNESMGMPSAGRFVGNIIMKQFVSAKSEAKRWKKQIDSSAGFALFMVEKNDIEHWIYLGRAFQRFGLMATKLGLSHAHVNMPCEEIDVRNKMAASLGLKKYHPLLLIRFGYSKKMPYSYRRPLEEVLLKDSA